MYRGAWMVVALLAAYQPAVSASTVASPGGRELAQGWDRGQAVARADQRASAGTIVTIGPGGPGSRDVVAALSAAPAVRVDVGDARVRAPSAASIHRGRSARAADL